jgi:hypothetical protein
MRAQFATFTVRSSQTERLEVEERHVGQPHPRMRGRCRVRVRRDGRRAWRGRVRCLIEESQTVAGKSGMDVGEASHGDGEGSGTGGTYVGTNVGTNERALKTGVGPQIASNQRQIDRCGPLRRVRSLGS